MNDNANGNCLRMSAKGGLHLCARRMLIALSVLFVILLAAVVLMVANGRFGRMTHIARRRLDIFANSLFAVSPTLDDVPSLVIVNKNNPLPPDYTVQLTKLDNGESVSAMIYPALQQMFDDARRDDIYPTVNAGYRTSEQQAEIMRDKVNSYYSKGYSMDEAERLAKKYVAQPGTSEHELGLAVDIVSGQDKWSSNKDVWYWLSRNAYKYGFTLRYPAGKEAVTGIDYEPWHYRYVGKEAAYNMYRNGKVLEEYATSNP